jgi:hypothetical protein
MSTDGQQSPEIDEKRWNAWLLKSKQIEIRTSRRMKIAAALLLGIGAVVFFVK